MSTFLNYVDGAWVPAADNQVFQNINPANPDDIIGEFPASSAVDAQQAIQAVACKYSVWAATDPDKRAQVLERAAALVLEKLDTLAQELTREEGKTLSAAKTEWIRVAQNFRLYAGEALRCRGETFPVADGSIVFSSREPVGVVLVITPWNFPVSLPSRKIAPALAYGNGVVFKPSEVTPLTGLRLVEILLEAGLPSGVIALVQGGGAELGKALTSADQVNAITFTGSYETGRLIHTIAGPDKRLQLEMGGKNACVVLDDADPVKAAQIIAQGAFNLTGQACTATSRAIIVGDIYDAVIEQLVKRAKAIKVGDGTLPDTQMGPLATKAQYDKVKQILDIAKSEGLKMVYGLEQMEGSLPAGGYFVAPTIFIDVPESSVLSKAEIFGPVVCLTKAGSYEEAVALANATEYGLAASIVTNNMQYVHRFSRDIEAGIVKVNSATGGVALSAPFGGIKHSSNQTYKEQAGHGVMDFYCKTKTVYLSA